MTGKRLWLYTFLLGAGAALVGLVIGFVVKTPPPSVAALLIMVGLLLLAGAILLGSPRKTKPQKKR
jgi:high-affinity Fe2+/Pb2+ permease